MSFGGSSQLFQRCDLCVSFANLRRSWSACRAGVEYARLAIEHASLHVLIRKPTRCMLRVLPLPQRHDVFVVCVLEHVLAGLDSCSGRVRFYGWCYIQVDGA